MSSLPTSPLNASFTMAQVHYLRRHYRDLPATHFAQRWGVARAQVYSLAKRHCIRKRAPNGAPEWREPRPQLPQAA